jgi:integrase/recombinase XerC
MSLIYPFLEYLKLERNYSVHTIAAYKRDIIGFDNFCSINNLEQIEKTTYVAIRQWLVFLSNNGVSPRTINRKVSALNTFYNYLLKIQERDGNPLVKHKALKVANKIQMPFSREELKEVFSKEIDHSDFESVRNITIAKLLYSTGMRRAELINLKLSDIDFIKQQVKVLGKRNKERIIPLLLEMIEQLKSYIELRNELSAEVNFLFLTKARKKIYPSLVYRVINMYFSPVSTKVKKSPHILRHTFATQLLNEGANLNGVKELLGHASLASTQVYTHNDIKKLKDAYKKAHPRNK